MDPALLPDAEHAYAVQQTLKEQETLLQRLKLGQTPHCACLQAQSADGHRQPE